MTGTILQVNVSPGGLPKRPVGEAFLKEAGFAGDSWNHPQIHGTPDKAVLLIGAEAIEDLTACGYQVFYGALGENLTTRGLERRRIAAGHRFRVGEALIEITRLRRPCRTLDIYGASLKHAIYSGNPDSALYGMSGFYARVLRPGLVRPKDIIALVAALA